MNEKTTVYLDPDLKKSANKINQEGKKRSMSALINELLAKWLNEQDKWY